MGEALDQSALEGWRRSPTAFIEQVMRDPETGRPFELLPCERLFFEHAYKTNEAGRLIYPEQTFACPKKTGKTAMAAMHMLTTALVFGGRYAEAYCFANDLEQAQGRVFAAIRRIVEASPYLRCEANVTQNRIEFPATGAIIYAIASDYASAAGANPVISCFDELWAYTSERSRRLWDEMVPVPTRKISCRLVTSYAGFEGESELLEGLYKRGLALPRVGPDLHAGDGLLMFWTHEPQAPWQTPEWLAQMKRSLRPNQYLRMIENRFVTSEENFVEMPWWDACATARPVYADRSLRGVWVGVDASVKRDSTGIAVVSCDGDDENKRVRLLWHRIFTPSRDNPIDFESMIEDTLLDINARFLVSGVYFDPYQMAATAQRLQRQGVNMVEFAQTPANLTAASQNLYELIKAQGLAVYPDDDIRLAVQRAVALETTRGWRIAKEKQSHKIDIVVALAMAAYAAVRVGAVRTWLSTGFCAGAGVVHYPDEPKPRIKTVYIDAKDMAKHGLRTAPTPLFKPFVRRA